MFLELATKLLDKILNPSVQKLRDRKVKKYNRWIKKGKATEADKTEALAKFDKDKGLTPG